MLMRTALIAWKSFHILDLSPRPLVELIKKLTRELHRHRNLSELFETLFSKIVICLFKRRGNLRCLCLIGVTVWCWMLESCPRSLRKLATFHHRRIRSALGVSSRCQQGSSRMSSFTLRKLWQHYESINTKLTNHRLECPGHLAIEWATTTPQKFRCWMAITVYI